MLLRVARDISVPPSPSRLICTLGMPFWSKLAWALDTLLTGDDDLALEPFAHAPARSALRYSKRWLLRRRRVRVGDQPELEIGHLAQDALGFGGVLDTRQLHHDAVASLALHQRLRHAEFVDPVAQRGEILA